MKHADGKPEDAESTDDFDFETADKLFKEIVDLSHPATAAAEAEQKNG